MIRSRRNRLMTTRSVAKMLNVHINTVRRWSDSGVLKGYRVGPRGDRRFEREEIAGMLSANRFGFKE